MTATHLEALLVYTDVLWNSPPNARVDQGDIPVIFGSWSADLVKGKWTITVNPGDRTEPRDGYPELKDYAGRIAAVRTTIFEKTRFLLMTRPDTLEGVYFPKRDMPRDMIREIIDNAVDKELINNKADTGFDIISPWPRGLFSW
jgi:hypothetical protein